MMLDIVANENSLRFTLSLLNLSLVSREKDPEK
jgi:hypothetical protein